MKHKQQEYVEKIIKNNIPVNLSGPSGCGKSSILMNAARNAGIKYSFITGSQQLSIGAVLGFLSVTGDYIRTPFRDAYEHGHYFNIEEANACSSNFLIIFNSLDNNIMPFPDGYTEPPHKNFRLMSTMNPTTSEYGARDTVDFSTDNRYYNIDLVNDENLVLNLTSTEVVEEVELLRELLSQNGSNLQLTMRDEMLLHKLKNLGLDEDPLMRLIDTESKEIKETIKEQLVIKQKEVQDKIDAAKEVKRQQEEQDKLNAIEASKVQSDMLDLESLIKKVEMESKSK